MTTDPTSDDAPPTAWGELRALVRLSLPLVLSQVGLMTMGLVDLAIVGRIDQVSGGSAKDALAAVGLGDSYVMSILLFGMGAAMGLDPVASQRLGAKDLRGARRALGDALWAGLALTPLLYGAVYALDAFVVGPVAAGNPPWEQLRTDPSVAADARAYFWARSLCVYPWIAFAAFRSWFYAKHLTVPMIVVIAIGNVANAVLDWVFVFGDAGLVRVGLPAVGLPAYGPLGAGIVTGIVNVVMALALIPPFRRERRREEAALAAEAAARRNDPTATPPPPPAPVESRFVGMRRVTFLGLPIAGQTVLEVLIFNLVAVMTSAYGSAQTAAHQVSIRVASFTFMATTGVAAAAAVRVGRAIGAHDTPGARRAGFAAIGLGAGWMAACGIVLVVFPEAIARVFTNDAEVVEAAKPLLRIAAVFQIFDGVQSVASGALRGTGDTLLPFGANFCAYWLIGFPVALDLKDRYGVAGMWWGLSIGLAVVAALLTWRFAHLTRRHVARVG